MRAANTGLLSANVTKCPQIKLADGLVAEPIGGRQRGQYADCTNPAAAIESKGKEKQFQFDVHAAFDASENARDNSNLFVENDRKEIFNLLAARFAPQAAEGLALDFAGKESADAGASEPKSQVINEIRCQQKGIGKNVTNVPRIDLRARGSPAPASPPIPVIKQCLRRGVFQCGTCTAATCRVCPPSGQTFRCFRRDIALGAGSVPH